nr:hypothetical protein [Salinigranum rubrum]
MAVRTASVLFSNGSPPDIDIARSAGPTKAKPSRGTASSSSMLSTARSFSTIVPTSTSSSSPPT